MTWLYATGGTGTIGRHLPEDVTRLNVDLSGDQTSFDATTFEKLLDNQIAVGPIQAPISIAALSLFFTYSKTLNVSASQLPLGKSCMNPLKLDI